MKFRRLLSWVGPLAAVVVAGLIWESRQQEAAAPDVPSLERERFDELSSELRKLRQREEQNKAKFERELFALRQHLGESPSDLHEAERPERKPTPTEFQELQQSRQAERLKRETEALQSAFSSEIPDERWNDSKQREIEGVLGRVATSGESAFRLKSVECRTTLCRSELDLSGPNAFDEFANALDDPAFAGGTFDHKGPEPNSRVLYVIREGAADRLREILGPVQ